MSSPSTTHAWYALRRTLPTWSFQENLEELVRVLPRYRVDEIIIKVDTEEFTHGQPPLDWVTEYQPRLFQIKEAMETLGIRYSINPWITVGHCDRGRDAVSQLPGLRTVVGHDGLRCTCCACPLSQVWRDNTQAVWRLYAETRPHVIWVEDDGEGIDPHDLPHIFERFYQVDKSRAGAGRGVGLGLTIAKQIVEAHEGTISVESVRDLGTKFTVSLPIGKESYQHI